MSNRLAAMLPEIVRDQSEKNFSLTPYKIVYCRINLKSGISIVQIPYNVILYQFLSQKYSCYIQSVRHSSFFPVPLIKHCGPGSDSPPVAVGQMGLQFCCSPVQKPAAKNKKTTVHVLFWVMCADCVWKAVGFFLR